MGKRLTPGLQSPFVLPRRNFFYAANSCSIPQPITRHLGPSGPARATNGPKPTISPSTAKRAII